MRARDSAEAMEIIDRLKGRGWHVEDIAGAIGCDHSSVSNWAAGRHAPIPFRLQLLRRLLRQPVPVRMNEEQVTESTVAIIERLKSRGWSVRQIARRLLLHHATISMYSQGKRKPTAGIPERLRALLRESPPRKPRDAIRDAIKSLMDSHFVYAGGLRRLAEVSGYSVELVSKTLRELELTGAVAQLDSMRGKVARWYVREAALEAQHERSR